MTPVSAAVAERITELRAGGASIAGIASSVRRSEATVKRVLAGGATEDWAPACMEADEWTSWQALNRRPSSASEFHRPCQDCPLGFALEQRGLGRCNGVPMGAEVDDDPEVDARFVEREVLPPPKVLQLLVDAVRVEDRRPGPPPGASPLSTLVVPDVVADPLPQPDPPGTPVDAFAVVDHARTVGFARAVPPAPEEGPMPLTIKDPSEGRALAARLVGEIAGRATTGPKPRVHACSECGEPFTPRDSGRPQVTCSPECQKRREKRREREQRRSKGAPRSVVAEAPSRPKPTQEPIETLGTEAWDALADEMADPGVALPGEPSLDEIRANYERRVITREAAEELFSVPSLQAEVAGAVFGAAAAADREELGAAFRRRAHEADDIRAFLMRDLIAAAEADLRTANERAEHAHATLAWLKQRATESGEVWS